MGVLPGTRKEFLKHWPKFSAWLGEHGSSVMAPTNPYEVARFLTAEGMGVVYANSADRITKWMAGADIAFTAWKDGAAWRAVERVKRGNGSKKRRPVIVALMHRDGCSCVYCGCPLGMDTATVEHLVPLTAGGPDTLINKALACQPCNQGAGALSPVEKMRRFGRMGSPQ